MRGCGPVKPKKSWKGQKMKFEELKEAFNLFDTEATGKIDPRYILLKYYYAKLRFRVQKPNYL